MPSSQRAGSTSRTKAGGRVTTVPVMTGTASSDVSLITEHYAVAAAIFQADTPGGDSVTDFYDSARSGLIPSGSSACVYYDGRYAITPAQAKRFCRVRWITIAGGASAAAHTGCIDYESGNLAYEGAQSPTGRRHARR